jgi:hypothetical protein
MKKLFTIAFLFAVSYMTSMSQSTLPNGNFEDWYFANHLTHAGGGFYEPGGGFFKSLNILDTIPTPPGLTCYRCDTVYSGNYAARVITRKIDALDILIPGVLGTLEINWQTLNATLGTPYIYSTRAGSFQGWYKSFPVGGDSTGAVILLSKWNATTHKRDTIGYKRFVFHETSTDYTFFDGAIEYKDTQMPDSITVLLLSCAGYNGKNMMACVGNVGSQALFDDVTVTDVNGFQYELMPEVNVKLSPNPVSNILRIELDKIVANGQFLVYTLDGKEILGARLSGIYNQVSVASLIPGSYYYKVSDGKHILNSGSFIVRK